MTFRWSDSPQSLARQFAAAAAALAGISVLLIALASWWWIDRLQNDASKVMQRQEVELRATRFAETLSRVEERARELANSSLLATALTDSLGRDAYLQPYLFGIQAIHGVPVELMVTDFEGKEVARNGDLGFTKAERDILLTSLASGEVTGQITKGDKGNSLLLSAPVIYRRTGTVEGAVWLKMSLTQLLQADGYVLRIGERSDPAPQNTVTAAIALPPSMASLSLHLDGQVRASPYLRTVTYIGPVLGGLLILVMTVSWVGSRLARRLTEDLAGLSAFADGVAGSSAEIERAPVKGSIEVVSLATSINHMLDTLQAQHEILQSESRARMQLLATCIANLNDVVMITEADPDHSEGHRIVFVNAAFTRMTGYTSEEVIGRGPKLLQGPDTDPVVLRHIGDRLRQWQPVTAEVKNYTKAGTPFWVKIEIVPVKDETGGVTHWVSVERDTTDSRAAEQQLKRSQQDLAATLEKLELASHMAKIGGWELDVATMQPYWSPETCRIHEVDPPVTPPLDRAIEFYAPEAVPTIKAAMQAAIDHGTPWDMELPMITAKGRPIWVRTQCICVSEGGKVVLLRGALQNITDRKRSELERELLERQLREAQKMESIGTLAGGIAHDFNNIIATMLGNAELARRSLDREHTALQSIDEIVKAGRRARELVRQILTFSRRQVTDMKPIALEPLVQEVVQMLSANLPAKIHIEVNAAAGVPLIHADSTQIMQVLMNLGTNAIQAMRGHGGNLHFSVQAVVSSLLAPAVPGDRAQPAVRLTVRDTGPGMDQATLDRMYEPFFTTKPSGEGTGLGLAVVHGIVKSHGGLIDVSSKPGGGTSFTIDLPAASGLPDAGQQVGAAPPVNAPTPTKSGDGMHILYLDDDDSLVFLVRRLLEIEGFKVTAFSEQSEAIAAVRANGDAFDLVISDFNMPGMNGIEVMQEMLTINPALKTAIASGFVDEALTEAAREAGVSRLIFKESAVEDFCAVIRGLIGETN
jgi:two-component system, cell cycle sensor histidine kinase and response regulator CckA